MTVKGMRYSVPRLCAIAALAALLIPAIAFAQKAKIIPEFVGGLKAQSAWTKSADFRSAAHACLDRFSFSKYRSRSDKLQKDCLARYLKAHGADPQAIAFMRFAPVPSVIAKLHKYRTADVVYADMMWADASGGWAIVGKSGEIVPLWAGINLTSDRRYRAFIKNHPRATLWSNRLDWPHVKNVGDGGQRFVFRFQLRNCNACAALADADVAFDFNRSGAFIGTHLEKIIAVKN